MHAHRASDRLRSARSGRHPGRRVARPAAGLGAACALVLLVAACSGDAPAEQGASDADGPTPAESGADEPEDAASHDAAEADEDGDEADEERSNAPEIDPAEVGADELGHVPVLMYHRLLDDGGGDFDLTPEEFRGELEWLFDNGYSPVRLKDLVRGEFDVPAGRSPVVLTFDDSTREQAQLTEDGELAPDTAMGILVEVADDYDDVEPLASLYLITSSLFGGGADGPDIVAHLYELGMELGNHTHNHPNLASLSADEVQQELARNVAEITDIVPDAEVVTLSLPLGVFPEDRELAERGGADTGSYHNEGILLVGSEPARSPFAADFDPLAIPRIRSAPSWDGGEPDFGSAFWLEQLEQEGSYRRYVSDGDPDTISFPADRADELDPAYEERANPY